MSKHINIVFDGPPSNESGRFVEVEDASGRSIQFGEWVDAGVCYYDTRLWHLRIDDPRHLKKVADAWKMLAKARAQILGGYRLGTSVKESVHVKIDKAIAQLLKLGETV